MTTLSRPWLRVCGVLLAAPVVFLLDPQSTSAWHALWLPLALVLAAYLMTQAPMAVAFATLALAVIHTDLNASGWIENRAYPLLALISLGVCAIIGWQRFRQRIAATHAERWAARQGAVDDEEPRT